MDLRNIRHSAPRWSTLQPAVAILRSVQRCVAALAIGLAAIANLVSTSAAAAPPGLPVYTLDQVVALAVASHPALRSQKAEEAVASARVDESTTRELPKVGVSGELNRSTGNTVPGAFFPVDGFPPIAGAVRGKRLDGGVWQTGVSLWASYDALALARQSAAIDVALAGKTQSELASNARQLEIAYRAADAFIALLEAGSARQSAVAAVKRAGIIATVTRTLVNQNLRPGADAARAEAELAAAQTLLARAEQAVQVRRTQLAVALGTPKALIEADPGGLLDPLPPPSAPPAVGAGNNPDLRLSDATVVTAKRGERVVDLEYLPRLDLVAAIWLRGSGLYASPAQGLGPDIPNWAVGAVVSWSFLDIPTIRAHARVASAQTADAVAKRDEVYLAVQGQLESASAIVEGARRVAQQTPVALQTARVAEQQAVARYKTGLTSVVDVADAERVLAQTEVEDAVAQLEVRRAMLLLARASGDLEPFLAQARKGGT